MQDAGFFQRQYTAHTPGLDEAITKHVEPAYREFVYRHLLAFKQDVKNIAADKPREKTLLEQIREQQANLKEELPASRPFGALEGAFVLQKAQAGWTAKQIARELKQRQPYDIVNYLNGLGYSLLDLRRTSGLGYRER